MTTKKCTKCGQEKELCCFGHTKRTLDNYEYQCKDCRKLWHVTYLANAKKDTPITHLVCSKCKIQKPVIMFQKNSGTKSGYCVYCKDCRRTKSKEVTPDGKLHCPKCDETKPAEQFHKNKNRKNGYNGWCNKCVKRKKEALYAHRKIAASNHTTLICIECHLEKHVTEFHLNKKTVTGYSFSCRDCTKLKRDKDRATEYSAKYFKEVGIYRMALNIQRVISELGGKCVRCGREATLDTFAAFDVHHKDPLLKTMSIASRKLSHIWTDALTTELKNCELLCACCHRLLHKTVTFDGILEEAEQKLSEFYANVKEKNASGLL